MALTISESLLTQLPTLDPDLPTFYAPIRPIGQPDQQAVFQGHRVQPLGKSALATEHFLTLGLQKPVNTAAQFSTIFERCDHSRPGCNPLRCANGCIPD